MHQHMNRLLLIALALFSSGVIARAGDQLPFKGTLSGQVISVTPVSDEVLVFRVTVTGIATHLGSFKGEAEIAQNVVTGSYSGTFTWIAANGDTVTGTFTGQLIPTATPGLFDNIEEITVTGGTRQILQCDRSCSCSWPVRPNHLVVPLSIQRHDIEYRIK